MRRYMIPAVALMAAMTLVPAAQAGPKGCPPGLAKKAVPCVPPGQAKKHHSKGKHKDGYYSDRYDHDRYDDYDDDRYREGRYRRGDVIRQGDYVIIRDPGRYGLDPYGTYYQARGGVYRVDRDTREILDLIGAVTAILN